MPSPARPRVTLAVVPRERFSFTRRALETIYQRTDTPFELIFVDGGSPAPMRRYLRRQASDRGFRLIRTWSHLSPNRARNLALRHVDTPYVVFLDNDVLVTPGWLDHLLACAEQSDAAIVGPTCCCYEPEGRIVHMAGGIARIVERTGTRRLEHENYLCGKLVSEIHDQLSREPTELVSFHCLLARTAIFHEQGPLDERLRSVGQDIDLCLRTRRLGGRVMFEPESLVTYVPPPPFDRADLAYFRRRWSTRWNRASIEWFRRKWRLEADDPGLSSLAEWLNTHRRLAPLDSVVEPRWQFLRRRRIVDRWLPADAERSTI